jgi:response regulator of citrate/malate metabolism
LGLLSLITVVLDDQQSVLASVHQLQDQRGALDGGAADYLIKPFEFPQLLAKLEAFAARADALASATGADQTLIASLFGSPRGSSGPTREDPLPKGLGAVTGQLVLDAVAPLAKYRRRNALRWWVSRASVRAGTWSTS